MIDADVFCDELAARGFAVASGVPCSYFGGPIEYLSRTPGRYVPAPNEGAALAVAVGVSLAGGRAYVMLQNSGLGNLINPLTSLVMVYQIPVLVFVSLRGWPDPADDEPQHEVMGQATPALLDALGIAHQTLKRGDDSSTLRSILDGAEKELSAHRPAFVLVEKGAVGKTEPQPDAVPADAISSAEAIRCITETAPGCAIIATTGYTSRELFGIADQPNNFYMQGSMGHAGSIGLGVALSQPHRTVIVLDGDGSALMHLGTLSSIGHEAPPNLIHVILDNGVHESTGGQNTTSATTSFSGIAASAGYKTAVDCRSLEDLRQAVRAASGTPGPHLCAVRTLPRGSAVPPRATSALSAPGLRDRFGEAMTREI